MRLSEKQIAISAVALALVALALLFFALQFSEPKEIAIASLPFVQENALVSFSGKVDSIEVGESDSAKMKVCESDGGACATVLFASSKINPYFFSKGDFVGVIGIARSYKGTKLMYANGITAMRASGDLNG